MKKTIALSLTLLIFMVYSLSLDALGSRTNSLAIGTNFSSTQKWSTEDEAKAFGAMAKSFGYSSDVYLSPVVSGVEYSAEQYNKKGGIVFFGGEGSKDYVWWNYLGQSSVFATGVGLDGAYVDGFTFVNLSKFAMNKTDFVMFMGCNTAPLNVTNLASVASSRGAKISMGWKTYIREGDTDAWLKRFLAKLSANGTFREALSYADEITYTSTGIKAWQVYAGSYIDMTLSQLSNTSKMLINDETLLAEATKESNSKIFEYDKKNLSQDDITNYIKLAFDSNLNINDYKIEYTNNGIYEVYDYVFVKDGFRTNAGYTIIVDDNIKVVNNMETLENSVNTVSLNSNNTYNEEQMKNDAMVKYEEKLKDEPYNLSIHDTLYRYDVETNKKYFDVYILAENTKVGTSTIITESFEL